MEPTETSDSGQYVYLLKSKCTSCMSSDISTSTVAWGRVYIVKKRAFRATVKFELRLEELLILTLKTGTWADYA